MDGHKPDLAPLALDPKMQKFVLRPSCPPDQVLSQIDAYARHILPHFGS